MLFVLSCRPYISILIYKLKGQLMRINCLFICPDSVSLPRFFSYTYILLGMNIYICVNYVTTFSYISCILWGMYLLYIIFSSNIVIEIIINGVIDEDAYNFSII